IHLIYISDLISGLVKLNSKKAGGEIFILSGEKPIKINEIVKIVSKTRKITPRIINIPLFPLRVMAFLLIPVSLLIRKEPLITKQRIDIISRDRFFSSEKAKRLLGFKPKV